MTDWHLETQGLDYDLWANRLWLASLQSKLLEPVDLGIMGHIISVEKLWLDRCAGVSGEALPAAELSDEAMTRLNADWKAMLFANRHDPPVNYRRMNGEPRTLSLGQIVRHVINHGTYHRGELRGLCLGRRDASYPETDLVLYYDVEKLNG